MNGNSFAISHFESLLAILRVAYQIDARDPRFQRETGTFNFM